MAIHNKKDGNETMFTYVLRLLSLSISGGIIIGTVTAIALKCLKFYFNNAELVQSF